MAHAVDPFEQYVQLQAASAELVRGAFIGTAGLKQRIEELENELLVWKLGHREAVKDREKAEREVRDYTEGDPLVLVLLDGDGCIFNRSFISRGRDGGREAALALTRQVMTLADKELGRSVQILCQVYYNKNGLAKVLNDLGIATPEIFQAFVLGLNAAHPLFTMTDVGPQKEAADAKFREQLRLFAKLPSCKLVLAGCGHDGGYSSTLQSLETEGLSGKIHLLKSYSDLAFELKRLNLKTVELEGIFEAKKLVMGYQGNTGTPKKANGNGSGYVSGKEGKKEPAPTPVATPKKFVFGMGPKPKEELAPEGFTPVVRKVVPLPMKQIDPKKSLSKQTPPPCNQFYLSKNSCSRGDCKYSHQYILTPKHLATLRIDAKKSPCIDALKEKPCTIADCYAGHRCPWGTKCRYGKACRFTAEMHPDGKATVGSGSTDDYSDTGSD